jgi:hypothetical protein
MVDRKRLVNNDKLGNGPMKISHEPTKKSRHHQDFTGHRVLEWVVC